MALPWDGPARLLSTIRAIISDRLVLVSELDFVPSSIQRGKDEPVSDDDLQAMVAMLKKSAPALYEEHRDSLENLPPLPADWRRVREDNERCRNEAAEEEELASYRERYANDKRFLKDCLSYLYHVPTTGSETTFVPLDVVGPVVELLPTGAQFLGFLLAEHVLGMICHTYNLKLPSEMRDRVHVEHGLATSVSPDTLLAVRERIGSRRREAVEDAYAYAFSALVKSGIDEGVLTKQQLEQYLDSDKDLAGSNTKAVLRESKYWNAIG